MPPQERLGLRTPDPRWSRRYSRGTRAGEEGHDDPVDDQDGPFSNGSHARRTFPFEPPPPRASLARRPQSGALASRLTERVAVLPSLGPAVAFTL